MNKLTEKEMMAILGYDDMEHSFQWYHSQYPILPTLIKQYIVNVLTQYKVFPKNVLGLDLRDKCLKFNYLIEIENNNFVVIRNDSDHANVFDKKFFKSAEAAADHLIDISYGINGSINKYW